VSAHDIRATARGACVSAHGDCAPVRDDRATARRVHAAVRSVPAPVHGVRASARGDRVSARDDRVPARSARATVRGVSATVRGVRATAHDVRASVPDACALARDDRVQVLCRASRGESVIDLATALPATSSPSYGLRLLNRHPERERRIWGKGGAKPFGSSCLRATLPPDPSLTLRMTSWRESGIGGSISFTKDRAWVVSAVVFATDIAYERLRLRNSPRATVWHASLAVGLGTLALARGDRSCGCHRALRAHSCSRARTRGMAADRCAAGVRCRARRDEDAPTERAPLPTRCHPERSEGSGGEAAPPPRSFATLRMTIG